MCEKEETRCRRDKNSGGWDELDKLKTSRCLRMSRPRRAVSGFNGHWWKACLDPKGAGSALFTVG